MRSGQIRPLRGLVLEGGGAKGAWKFGLLKAFAKGGLRFDVVSGTSVCALNGAIWCWESIEASETLWNNISPTKLFLVRPWFIPIFALAFS